MSSVTKIKLVIEQISSRPDLSGFLRQVNQQDEYFVLGDFSSSSDSRYSYFGLVPSEILSFADGDQGDPFDLLTNECNKYNFDYADKLPTPFVGGWVGFLNYDLGRYIEQLPNTTKHDIPLDLLRFGFYSIINASCTLPLCRACFWCIRRRKRLLNHIFLKVRKILTRKL